MAQNNVETVVLAALASANEVDWNAVLSQLNEREKRMLHPTLHDMKRRGLAWRKVSLNAQNQSVVTIVKGKHPNLKGD